jgi:hypothetical protein
MSDENNDITVEQYGEIAHGHLLKSAFAPALVARLYELGHPVPDTDEDMDNLVKAAYCTLLDSRIRAQANGNGKSNLLKLAAQTAAKNLENSLGYKQGRVSAANPVDSFARSLVKSDPQLNAAAQMLEIVQE